MIRDPQIHVVGNSASYRRQQSYLEVLPLTRAPSVIALKCRISCRVRFGKCSRLNLRQERLKTFYSLRSRCAAYVIVPGASFTSTPRSREFKRRPFSQIFRFWITGFLSLRGPKKRFRAWILGIGTAALLVRVPQRRSTNRFLSAASASYSLSEPKSGLRKGAPI